MQSFKTYANSYSPVLSHGYPISGISFTTPPSGTPISSHLDATNIPPMIQITDTTWISPTMPSGNAQTPLGVLANKPVPMGIGSMGIGNLGNCSNPHRKFRWTMEIGYRGQKLLDTTFVKVSNRPTLEVEETEINHLNEKTWIPGKTTNKISVTLWLDSNVPNPATGLMSHLAENNGGIKKMVGVLKLWDGCGGLIEEWKLNDLFIQAVNFGELDYSSANETTVELTMVYSGSNYRTLTGQGQLNSQFTCVVPEERLKDMQNKIKAYCPSFQSSVT